MKISSALEQAEADASDATRLAGVVIRPLDGAPECVAASTVLAGIWGTSLEAAPISSDLLTSLIHAGSCVLGAVEPDGTIVGVVVGLTGGPRSDEMYSLIAGVSSTRTSRGVGIALKRAQRLWALQRGATRMVWTYDPLVRRNAHFNLNRLGARAVAYVPEFYPPMHDALNRSDVTDRLTVLWDLLEPAPAPGERGRQRGRVVLEPSNEGEPKLVDGGDGDVLAVWIPADIEAMRRTDPGLAMRWRLAMREALQRGAGEGRHPYRVTTDGYYLLVREEFGR